MKTDSYQGRQLTNIILAAIVGFILGGIVLALTGYHPLEAYGALLSGFFSKPKYIAQVVVKSTPIILTGLSFLVAFKSGLFNMGAEGQYLTGAITATIVGSKLELPGGLHFLAAVVSAITASALLGAVIGILKTKWGVNEVISCIMFNWILLYLNNYLITIPWLKKPDAEASYEIRESAWSLVAGKWKTSQEGIAALTESNSPFAEMLLRTDLNYGIVIAVITAAAVGVLYKRTTIGYRLQSVGANIAASRLSGIGVEKNIIGAMTLSAAISGLAGALTITGMMPHRLSQLMAHEGYGFAGIAVSLIGANSPIGCIFSGLFYSMLEYGSLSIQSETGAASEIMDLVIGTIIFFIAISSLFRIVLGKGKRKENHYE